MRIIDADTVVTIQVFDEMYEEYNLKTMTIAEALDLWTEEGCPSSAEIPLPKYTTLGEDSTVDTINREVVRCKDCRQYIPYDLTEACGWCCRYKAIVEEDDYCSHGERQCNYFEERKEEINGFKSVGQAWNTSQGRRYE